MGEEIKSGKKNVFGRFLYYIDTHEWALTLCWFACLCIGSIILIILIEISSVFILIWVVFSILLLVRSFAGVYSWGVEDGYKVAENPPPQTIEIRNTWPSHMLHASKTIIFLYFVIFFFPWFIIYSFGKLKGKRDYNTEADKEIEKEVKLFKEHRDSRAQKNETESQATEKESAGELNMDMEEFKRIKREANGISLTKGDKGDDSIIEVQKRHLKNLLTMGLNRTERLIVVLYYYDEMTMKEIGATLDLSEERVRQIHSSLVARLRDETNNRE